MLANHTEGSKVVRTIWPASCSCLILPEPQQENRRHRLVRCGCSSQGGQALLASMDVRVHRNYFGSQVGSFEAPVSIVEAYRAKLGGNSNLPGVFIRAPAVLAVGEGVDVVATVRAARASAHRAPGITPAAASTLAAGGSAAASSATASDAGAGSAGAGETATDVIVAAVQGQRRLVTAFHPELTPSRNWHEMFIQMVEAANADAAPAVST